MDTQTRGSLPKTASSSAELARFATTFLCYTLIALGVIWRFSNLDYPAGFTFDEHHFVLNARNYIARLADWNDHPPLGKLLLIPGMRIFGDSGFGWRISSAILGIPLFLLAGWNASRIFGNKRVGLLVTAFVAIDGFFISYSRTALLDTPLTLFMYGALACMLWRPALGYFAAAAVCVGLAVATKWTGVCILLVAPWLLRKQGRSVLHTAWMFALAGLVYVAVVAVALVITKQPLSLAGILGTNWSLLQHHAGFTVWDNSASSHWYTWPLLTHPIVMHYEEVSPGVVRSMSMIGNLALWYATTAGLLLALAALGRAAYRWLRTRQAIPPFSRAQAFVVATMIALVLQFILTNRQSYMFHYLGAYGVGLSLVAARLIEGEKRYPWLVPGALILVLGVALLYFPLWTTTPQSRAAFLLRLPFPGWR